MDGILLINKEKGWTSRDVVNIVSKFLNTRKVGHFGTLDPLATGLLILGVGKYTKFQKVMDKEIKEYVSNHREDSGSLFYNKEIKSILTECSKLPELKNIVIYYAFI